MNNQLHSCRRWLSVGAVVIAMAALICGPVQRNAGLAVATIRNDWQEAWCASPEGRRIAFYGDRSGLGYGYVLKALEGYPDPDSVPEIRNPQHDEFVSLFLPGHLRHVDGRMLIGIGIPEADRHEGTIASAVRVDGGGRESIWEFATGSDVDTFVGLDVTVGDSDRIAGTAQLLGGPRDPSILALGAIEGGSGAGQRATFRPPPVTRFSIHRGAEPFLIRISGVDPTRVEVVGIRVDIRGYEVLTQEGECFVAARNELLAVSSGPAGEGWLRYFQRLRCGGL